MNSVGKFFYEYINVSSNTGSNSLKLHYFIEICVQNNISLYKSTTYFKYYDFTRISLQGCFYNMQLFLSRLIHICTLSHSSVWLLLSSWLFIVVYKRKIKKDRHKLFFWKVIKKETNSELKSNQKHVEHTHTYILLLSSSKRQIWQLWVALLSRTRNFKRS